MPVMASARHGFTSNLSWSSPPISSIFGLVLGSRINASEKFPGDYTSYMIIGLVPWLVTQNILARGPGVFTANSNLVKQVVFPIEVLPVASMLAAFLIFMPSYAIMIGYKLIGGGGLTAGAFLLVPVMIMHAMLALGMILILSVVTPFFRDLREIVTIYLSVSMYFTPAIYLPEWLPRAIRPLIYLNPFSYVVWCYQDALFFGHVVHSVAWIVFAAMSVLILFVGVSVFAKVRSFLGNVL